MLDIVKDRARPRLKRKGLSQNFIKIDSIEKALREKDDDITDIEMIDEHINKLITQGLKDSKWAVEIPKDTISNGTILGVDKQINATKSVGVQTENTLSETSTALSKSKTQNLLAETTRNTENTPEKAMEVNDIYRRNDIPPELRTIIQAEEYRAFITAANLKTCTGANNGVQGALSTSEMDCNKEFVQNLLTYLRAAIA